MDHIKAYNQWLSSAEVSEADKALLGAMSADQIKESFYTSLEFGTAGMRGIISPGTNRMNVFTVRRATKGLADYICSLGMEAAARGVVISYDTRRYSAEFAKECARILSANGINSYLFEDVRPVPICSFAIRHFGAQAGIMITASHNPKEYNGYKVYGEDGAQMSPEATAEVVKCIESAPYFGLDRADADLSDIKGKDAYKADEHITVVGASVDEAYFCEIEKLSLSPEAVRTHGAGVKIVYTPVHGSGAMPVTAILARMGITVNVVPEQAQPDTEFSTVRVPNPEEADTLSMGIALADRIGSDVVIGTDPDADRMGVAIRDDEGAFMLLNGNQIGVLLADYIMMRKREDGVLPKNGAIVKTIVTTELARRIADSYGVTTFDVLTGFKFIGEKIKEWETTGEYVYLFGFEESYGSLAGTHARDKDAVVAAMLFAEMICCYESRGMTLYNVLENIYRKFGYFREKSISITFGGLDGMQKMKDIMLTMRGAAYGEIAGEKAACVYDFVTGTATGADGAKHSIELPKTNALKIVLANGDWLCVRPSGTEPKLKIYSSAARSSADRAAAACDEYLEFMRAMTK